jgi:hypothetical protein
VVNVELGADEEIKNYRRIGEEGGARTSMKMKT